MSHSLDSFSPDFWHIENEECVKHSGGRPTSVEQALWEMGGENWEKMVDSLFLDCDPISVSVDDVMILIGETNTCSGLDSSVEVWIDKKGDFKIKVYE